MRNRILIASAVLALTLASAAPGAGRAEESEAVPAAAKKGEFANQTSKRAKQLAREAKRISQKANAKVNKQRGRVDAFGQRLGAVEGLIRQLDDLPGMVEDLGRRVTDAEGLVEGFGATLEDLEKTVAGFDTRIADVEGLVDALGLRVDDVEGLVEALGLRVDDVEALADALRLRVDDVEADVAGLDGRVGQLEAESRATRDTAAATVSTPDDTDYVSLGGPEVTVTVPDSGLIEVWAQVTIEPEGAVSLYEDGQRMPGQDPDGACPGPGDALMAHDVGFPLTLSTPTGQVLLFCGIEGPPSPVMFSTTPGEHTYELRYADCGCDADPAEFSDRTLTVAPRP